MTKFNDHEVRNFTYKTTDFHSVSLKRDNKNWENRSEFDKLLCTLWDKEIEKGTFSYPYTRSNCKYKTLESDSYDSPFLCQLNKFRGTNKRPRKHMDSMTLPFSDEVFNFKKIPNKEILFRFSPDIDCELRKPAENSSHYCIINAAPIEYGHILVVPELQKGHFQKLSEQSVRLSIDLLLLSNQPSFRVMWNSIWAWASINHNHVHAMYMDHEVGGDNMSIQKEPITKRIFRTDDSKAWLTAFIWDDIESDPDNVATKQIAKFIDELYRRKIPSNIMCLYRPETLKPRFIVWPRKSAYKVDPHPAFDGAVAEMGGHLPYKTEEEFDNATFTTALEHLRKGALLPNEVYDELEVWIKENL